MSRLDEFKPARVSHQSKQVAGTALLCSFAAEHKETNLACNTMDEDIFAVSDEEQPHSNTLFTPPAAAAAAAAAAGSRSQDSQPDSSLKRKAVPHSIYAPASNKKHHLAGQDLSGRVSLLHVH